MIVRSDGPIVTVTVGDQELELSYAEANDLQAKLRLLLAAQHVMIRDVL